MGPSSAFPPRPSHINEGTSPWLLRKSFEGGGMDPRTSQQKRRAMAGFRRAESAKRALLSVSLVSFSFLLFLASLSSWLPTLLHHGDCYLQDFPLLLVHLPDWLQVDRKAMFLVCNVILWIVFRDSGLLGPHNAPEEGPRSDPPARREGPLPSEAKPAASSAGSLLVPSAQGKGSDFVEEKGKGEEGEEAEEGEEEEEEEEEEDGFEENMNELNKRFEDFIQKVKRERTLEALQLAPV